jgi:hypothetical protein
MLTPLSDLQSEVPIAGVTFCADLKVRRIKESKRSSGATVEVKT